MTIPFIDLKAQQDRIRPQLDRRIEKVLDHGRYIMGPEVVEFEEALSQFVGCKHVVSLSNGTDALRILLGALEVGVGDAVFVPSFTFTATAEVILQCGAHPVFVEVDERSFNIDVEALESAIATTNREGRLRPKAVIAVDLFGQPADYAKIEELASRHGIEVIADAAQSMGASRNGVKVGNFGRATATSFFPAKPLGCYGDGGAVLTNDDDTAAICRSLRAHGKGAEKYDIDLVGFNARLDTIQAAVLLAKLEIFPDELERRQTAAAAYERYLPDAVIAPSVETNGTSAWAQYVIKCADRDDLMRALGDRGIPTQIYYPRPMHLQNAYLDFANGPGSLPVSERLCSEVLALPMHPYLQEETVGEICEAISGLV